MFIYTALATLASIIAAIVIAVRTKKAEGVVYTNLDKAGIVTNILLTLGYTFVSPFYLILGLLSSSGETGFLGVIGWIVSTIVASALVPCALGLGFSVSLRRKGKSKLSFAIQFIGILGMIISFVTFLLCYGNLISPIN